MGAFLILVLILVLYRQFGGEETELQERRRIEIDRPVLLGRGGGGLAAALLRAVVLPVDLHDGHGREGVLQVGHEVHPVDELLELAFRQGRKQVFQVLLGRLRNVRIEAADQRDDFLESHVGGAELDGTSGDFFDGVDPLGGDGDRGFFG